LGVAIGVSLLLVLTAACGGSYGTPTAAAPDSSSGALREELLKEGLVYRTLDAKWEQTPAVKTLVNTARSDGGVHITAYDQDQVDAWCSAFTSGFGVPCSGRGLSGAQIVSTLVAEREAGEPVTDVVYISMSQAQQLLDRGYVAKVGWETLGVDPGRVWSSQGEGNAVGVTQSQYTHFYNTDLVSPADLPQTLEEWLDPRHRGQICTPDFLFRAGNGFIALLLGMNAAVDLAQRLIQEQEMLVTSSCEPLLVSGERPLMFLGYGNPPSLLEGNPVGQFWNAGLGVNLFSTVVPTDAPHPNAGRLFAAWASSREASRISYEAIGQGWAAFGHGPEGLVSGEFAIIDLVYESPSNFDQRGKNTRAFQERVLGP
jgi:ABC-type Fe3+ transport system substrate-binding protein